MKAANNTPHRTRARASRLINRRAARAGKRERYAADDRRP